MVCPIEENRINCALLDIRVEQSLPLIVVGKLNNVLHHGAIPDAFERRIEIALVSHVNAVDSIDAGVHDECVVL